MRGPGPENPIWTAAIDRVAGRGPGETLDGIAVDLGIDPSTLWRWRQDADFLDQVRELTQASWTCQLGKIDRKLLSCIEAMPENRPNPALLKLAYERAQALVTITEDRSFERFVQQMDGADKDELEYYVENGQWPEKALATA